MTGMRFIDLQKLTVVQLLVFVVGLLHLSASASAQTGGQWSLNELEVRMVEAVQNEYYQDFLTYLSEYERRGGTVVPDMIYYKAVALESIGDILDAFDEVDRFLGSVPGSHPKHLEARAMMVDLAEKVPPIQELVARLESAWNNSEELTILRDYLRENLHLSRDDTRKRYAERQIAAIEGPLTIAASDWRFEAILRGDPIEGEIQAMAFNRDGSILAIGAGSIWPTNIFITDARDGRHILSSIYEYAQPTWNTRTSMTMSPADDLLVLGMQDGRISFFRYDGSGLQFSLKAPTLKEVNPIMLDEIDPVEEISFSSDGSRVVTLHASRTVIVYDVENRKTIWTFLVPEQNGINYFIALSPDGKKVLTSGEWEASLWDVERQMGLFSIKATQSFSGVAYAPDGQAFMLMDSTLKVYDAINGQLLQRHSKGRSYTHIAAAPTGRFIQANSGSIQRDSIGRVYDNPAEIRVYEPDGSLSAILRGIGAPGECRQVELEYCRGIAAVAISGDGKLVAAATSDGYLRFWRLR